MTPVKSSWIKAIGFDEGSVYMQVHEETSKGIDTYEYNPSDPEAIWEDWIESDNYGGSKGKYWWDHIRDVFSPAFKHGKPPAYLETGYGEELAFTQPEATREFKMEGDVASGTIGVGTTAQPYPLPAESRYEMPSDMYNPTTVEIPEQTTTTPSVYTPGRVYDPSSITGHKKTGPGAKRKPGKSKTRSTIVPYNVSYNPSIYNEKFKSVLNSASALRRFAKTISTEHLPTGWGMKTDTPYKIRELIYALANDATRLNRVSFGNSIKAGHPYNYGGEDEFICPRDYKLNIGKTVPLGIYHNLETPGEIDLPDWQVIGTHEVLGWDDELGQEIARNNYDVDKIEKFFKIRNERNWIWDDYLSKGVEPPISGAYSCNVKNYNNTNYQVNINLKSMSFVPDANCPWDICNFQVHEEMVS
jgi:hypothetical protein